MSYKIGFDGVVSAELKRLLQSVENRVNGFGMHAQATDVATTVASGSPPPPCMEGQPCPGGIKYGHDAVVIGLAIVGGAVAGFAAGKLGAKSVKG